MAQDWIKMRTWLAKDPKVIAMASELAGNRSFVRWLTHEVQCDCKETAYEHVEQKVIVSIVVAGLLQVWGTARVDGKKFSEIVPDMSGTCPVNVPELPGDISDDDLILTHSTTITLDDISGVDGFGDAMKEVGWVIEVEGPHFALVFPKFFLQNHNTKELNREYEREKKRNQRANVSPKCPQNVPKMSRTKTGQCPPREEKRREEKSKEEERVPTVLLSADADASTNGHMGPSASVLQEAWNRIVVKGQRCEVVSGKRAVHLKNRNRDPYFREHWQAALQKIAESPFCCGDNQRGWVATIDWFLRPDTVLKLIEGFYDGREPAAKGGFLAELYGGKA